MKMMTNGFHPIDAMQWNQDAATDVYVVHLKTGAVELVGETRPFFSAHHANAFERDGVIVVDVCETFFQTFRTYFNMVNILSPKSSGADRGLNRLRRFLIDLSTKRIFEKEIKSQEASPPLGDTMEFPTINEAFRGRSYCFLYGIVFIDYTRQTLVKRSLCDPTKDRALSEPGHFYSEMSFAARPDAASEDDGVLATVGFDGAAGKSYLMLIDAETFVEIDRAFLPHRMPMSFHGRFFD